jgi:hypothetical protein
MMTKRLTRGRGAPALDPRHTRANRWDAAKLSDIGAANRSFPIFARQPLTTAVFGGVAGAREHLAKGE